MGMAQAMEQAQQTPIQKRLERYIEILDSIDDPMDRYTWLMDF